MKITRKQLRRIISETMKFTGGGKTMTQARTDMNRVFAGSPDLDGWDDLTSLEETLDQLLSPDGQYLYEKAFGKGSYTPIHRDFDADGIFNGGKNIIAALERLGLEQSLDSIYHYVLKQWAEKHTGEQIFTELSEDEYFANRRS